MIHFEVIRNSVNDVIWKDLGPRTMERANLAATRIPKKEVIKIFLVACQNLCTKKVCNMINILARRQDTIAGKFYGGRT